MTLESTAGSIAASGMSITNGGEVSVTAKTEAVLNEAALNAANLTAEAGEALAANGARIETRDSAAAIDPQTGFNRTSDNTRASLTLSVTGEDGTVSLDGATLNSAGGVHVKGPAVSVAGTEAGAGSGGIRIETTRDDLDVTSLTSDGISLSGTYVELVSAGELNASGQQIHADASMLMTAAGDVNATDAALDFGHSAGRASLDVNAAGSASLAGTKLSGEVGDVTLEAGDALNVSGVFRKPAGSGETAAPLMSSLTLEAGTSVDMGEDAVEIHTDGAGVSLAAQTLAGDAVAAGSVIEAAGAAGDIRVALDAGDITLEEGTEMRAGRAMTLDSGNLSLGVGVGLEAGREMALTARDALTAASAGATTEIIAPGLTMKAGGDVMLEGSVVAGDRTPDASHAHVSIEAGGAVTQTPGAGDAGVRGASATVTAATGDIRLDAQRNGASGGNALTSLALESAGDVSVGLAGRANTAVTVNGTRGGEVAGDLRIHAQNTGVSLNAISAQGDISVHAASISGSDLRAGGETVLTTSLYDRSPADGVHMTGMLSGSAVTVNTDKGDITLSDVRSDSGKVNLMRLSKDNTEGEVTFRDLTSADTAFVYNGNGLLMGDTGHSQDTMYLVVGTDGNVIGRSQFISARDKVGVVRLGYNFTPELGVDYIGALSASAVPVGNLPFINASEVRLAYAMRDNLSPMLPERADLITPVSPYFFLGVRPDASVAQSSTEGEVQEAEAGSRGEGVESRPALLFGLPDYGKPEIRDLRPVLEETQDFSWLVSMADTEKERNAENR